MHPQMVKLVLYCSDVMIIMVNCSANVQVSNLAMIIIQTVNNININSYVCKKYKNNLVLGQTCLDKHYRPSSV